MSKPLAIPRKPDEPDSEYLLRIAAAFIRHHAQNKEVIHDLYEDDEPCTGEEIAISLAEQADELEAARQSLNKGMTVRGTIIQAGTNQKNNEPTITIITSAQELKRQKQIPFFKSCEIDFRPAE